MVVPPVRRGEWCQASVRRVLTNVLYMGYVRNNGDSYPGAHQPLVSEELWHAAAKVREAAIRTKGTAEGAGRRGRT